MRDTRARQTAHSTGRTRKTGLRQKVSAAPARAMKVRMTRKMRTAPPVLTGSAAGCAPGPHFKPLPRSGGKGKGRNEKGPASAQTETGPHVARGTVTG
jgi:hypothetical protein